jgi:hypothetical protein
MQKRKMKDRKQDMMDKGGVVGAVLYIRVSYHSPDLRHGPVASRTR